MSGRAVAALVVGALLLTGCGTASGRTNDRLQACLAAGGSYEYDGSDGSWSCTVPDP